MSTSPPSRVLVPVLIFVGTVVAVISSLGAPLIPAIAATMATTLPSAQWALTVTLLVGAVATPVIGRLGDGPHRRAVVLVVLAVVTIGGVLAALPLGLEWLILGRGLQGFGLGLTPLAIAAAREALEGERSRSTIAALSITVVAGVGLGYPLAGLVAELGGVHAAFWAGAAVSLAALVASAAVLPASRITTSRPLDVLGALLLGAGLAGALLALGQVEVWGWTSPLPWVLLGGSALMLACWAHWELRTPSPLVDLRLAQGRVAATAHSAALLVGLSNYLLLASVPVLTQAPRPAGRGSAPRSWSQGWRCCRSRRPACSPYGSPGGWPTAPVPGSSCPSRPSSRAAPSSCSGSPARSCGRCSWSWRWPGSGSGPPSRPSRRWSSPPCPRRRPGAP